MRNNNRNVRINERRIVIIRNEKRRMDIYVMTGVVLIAVAIVLSVAVLRRRDSKSVQAQAASPSYTDEDSREYIAAFLKGMTDSTITVDIAEFITGDDTERIKELVIRKTGKDIFKGHC